MESEITEAMVEAGAKAVRPFLSNAVTIGGARVKAKTVDRLADDATRACLEAGLSEQVQGKRDKRRCPTCGAFADGCIYCQTIPKQEGSDATHLKQARIKELEARLFAAEKVVEGFVEPWDYAPGQDYGHEHTTAISYPVSLIQAGKEALAYRSTGGGEG